MDKLALKITS